MRVVHVIMRRSSNAGSCNCTRTASPRARSGRSATSRVPPCTGGCGVRNSGSARAADNRTPERNELIELRKRNRQLEMEVDVSEQAAPVFTRKQRPYGPTPAAARYQRSAGSSALPSRPTTGCSTTPRPNGPTPMRRMWDACGATAAECTGPGRSRPSWNMRASSCRAAASTGS